MSKRKPYTDRLRKRMIAWKEEVVATYSDIARILGCNMAKPYVFCSGRQDIGYEFGKQFEEVIKWNEEAFYQYKKLMKEKKRVNKS